MQVALQGRPLVQPGLDLVEPELPPDGFDPLAREADPELPSLLERFSLPERPDPEAERELYEHWHEMFEEPLHFVRAESRPVEDSVVLPMLRTAQTVTSPNWSGGVIAAGRGRRFTRAAARWLLPEVRPGNGPNPAGLPFRCSVWVGLDGHRRWTRSMPQLGSEHTVGEGGAPDTHRLWWQWWVRDTLTVAQSPTGVPVAPGQVVLCNLTLRHPGEVRFHWKNRSTGDFATQIVTNAVPARGSTAEWIVERPSEPVILGGGAVDPGPMYPLPDYRRVVFRRCATRLALAPGMAWERSLLRTPRLIRMIQRFPLANGTRSVTISVPRRREQPNAVLRVRYKAPP